MLLAIISGKLNCASQLFSHGEAPELESAPKRSGQINSQGSVKKIWLILAAAGRRRSFFTRNPLIRSNISFASDSLSLPV
jgi:hypothetical protein